MTIDKLAPVHPGEVLFEEFLKPFGLSQNRLALNIGVPPRRINEIVGNYTPPPMAPARPGALDYQRCASQGVRC